MSTYEIMMLLCQNMLYKVLKSIDKFLIRYKEFYIKTTTNKFRINYIEEISIKSDQKLLLLYIIVNFIY